MLKTICKDQGELHLDILANPHMGVGADEYNYRYLNQDVHTYSSYLPIGILQSKKNIQLVYLDYFNQNGW